MTHRKRQGMERINEQLEENVDIDKFEKNVRVQIRNYILWNLGFWLVMII